MNEIADNLGTTRGMNHLGMELEAEIFTGTVLDGSVVGVLGDSNWLEPLREPGELVAV
jgi:hypothetical protein